LTASPQPKQPVMGMGKKRGRDEDGDDDAGPRLSGAASLGQQTSYIKNKLVRSEKYAKLKHKQKVRRYEGAALRRDAHRPSTAAAFAFAAALRIGAVVKPPPFGSHSVCFAAPKPRPLTLTTPQRSSASQKAKKAERKKRQDEAAKAEELGLEPPPRQQQRVRGSFGWRVSVFCCCAEL